MGNAGCLEINDREKVVKLIRQWGGLTTDALLDDQCTYFSMPEVEGLIGYRVVSGCGVVFGDPVCSPDDVPLLAQAFHRFCCDQKIQTVYLMASEPFSKWALQNISKAAVQYGEELSLNPQNDPRKNHGTQASLVRRKVKHALKEGTTVKEHLLRDMAIEQEMEVSVLAWLQARRGPQVHISKVHLFDDHFGKRWFYAQKDGKIVGILVINQLQAKNGWLLNHLMITPEAPHGTPELLVVSALETLGKEGCKYVTFGAAPQTSLGQITGLSGISSWMARVIYQAAYRIFHLKGHKMFWGKFHPETEPSYLLFSRPKIGLKEIRALMHTMNVSIKI